jgi:sortase A
MKHFSKWFKRNSINIILLSLIFTGVGLILYPSLSNWYNMHLHAHVVMDYAEEVGAMDQETIDAIWNSAETYNRKVAEAGNDWMPDDEKIQRYLKELQFNSGGVMGYLFVQKINLSLPIYHTTAEEVIKKGAGHLTGTSLPVGGESTHSVLSSHRGLPTAMLFTDLDKLVIGDTFQLNILNRTLTYEVDQIRIVEPTDFSDLAIEEGQDYCTLLTCTPYGINSHRMLVRGHRTKTKGSNAAVPSDAMQYEPVLIAPFFAAPILLLGLGWLFITTSRRAGIRRSRERALSEVVTGKGTVVSSGESETGQAGKRNGKKRA